MRVTPANEWRNRLLAPEVWLLCEQELGWGRQDDQMIVKVTSGRHPRLYFDQFAIYEFSSKPEFGERRFADHGELFFSFINLMEIGALRGRSAALVRDFLSRIGPNWVPLEWEFDKVVVGENDKSSEAPHPALSRRLLEFVYRSGPVDEPITLDRIIDEFAKDDIEQHRAFLSLVKDAMAANVKTWQRLPREEVERQLPVLHHAGPTLYLAARIIRALVEEAKSFQWVPNDAFDFSHALAG